MDNQHRFIDLICDSAEGMWKHQFKESFEHKQFRKGATTCVGGMESLFNLIRKV
jgi:hypothetical protein